MFIQDYFGIFSSSCAHIEYIWDVYSWNTWNNLRKQEPLAVIFAPHMCISVLFGRGKFEMCVPFH